MIELRLIEGEKLWDQWSLTPLIYNPIDLIMMIPRITLLLVLIFCLPMAEAEGLLAERLAYWQKNAFLCKSPDGKTFPSRPTGISTQPCDDGDITLFNGLLCAAGDERGCRGVADAQDDKTGQWYRSPRIRISGNDRGGSAFSPDMALGVQLYLIKTKDIVRATRWLSWLHTHVPCTFELFDKCFVEGLPRFCTDDVEEKGCTMRPGDAAMLAATLNHLQTVAGMPPLPNGRLRGYLGTFSGIGPQLEQLSSIVNKPGYSQHLVAVSVLLHRMMGATDSRLDDAASRIANKNSGNAFYSFLAGKPISQVENETTNRCPNPDIPLKLPLHQWQWERDNEDKAWEHSCFWDCIFMAGLISNKPY